MRMERPPTHPIEPGYPCSVSGLGEFTEISPREGPDQSSGSETAAARRLAAEQTEAGPDRREDDDPDDKPARVGAKKRTQTTHKASI